MRVAISAWLIFIPMPLWESLGDQGVPSQGGQHAAQRAGHILVPALGLGDQNLLNRIINFSGEVQLQAELGELTPLPSLPRTVVPQAQDYLELSDPWTSSSMGRGRRSIINGAFC